LAQKGFSHRKLYFFRKQVRFCRQRGDKPHIFQPFTAFKLFKFRNVTISDNIDKFGGGIGIVVDDIDFDSYNSIFANHNTLDCFINQSSNYSGEYNIESSEGCDFNPVSGTDMQFSDPKLAPPTVNGGCNNSTPIGCTFKQTPITPGSPGVDAGDDPTCAHTDQRGFVRPSPCDIGAYELF
tara:strand:- start:11887 stop:12429 length:543 start_codon:yes stop_codon:yes gene_type:complete